MTPDKLADYERSIPEYAEAVILARFAAQYGVRNTELENLHAGKSPADGHGSTRHTKVVCGKNEIFWDQVKRFSDREMHSLMLNIEKQLTLVLQVILEWERSGEMPERIELIKRTYFSESGISWDRPPKKWQEMREERRQIRAIKRDKQQPERKKNIPNEDSLSSID